MDYSIKEGIVYYNSLLYFLICTGGVSLWSFLVIFKASTTVNPFRLKVVRAVKIVFTLEGHPLQVPMC